MTLILSVCLSAIFRFTFCLPLLILFFSSHFPSFIPNFSLLLSLYGKNLLLVRQTRLGSGISRSVHFAPKTFHSYFIFPPPEFHYFSWRHRMRYDEQCKAKYPMRIGAARKAIRDRQKKASIRAECDADGYSLTIFSLFIFYFLFFSLFSLFSLSPCAVYFHYPVRYPYPFLSRMDGERGGRCGESKE